MAKHQKDFNALVERIYKNQVSGGLNVMNMELTDTDAEELALALEGNNTITSLDIRYNQIGDVGAQALAAALQQNRRLRSISLCCNRIGDEGAKALGAALQENGTLTGLHLWNNEIGDEGIRALAEALEQNLTLSGLNISDNNIGSAGIKFLAEALSSNQHLHTLYLWGNRIGDAEVQILADALQYNRSLNHLDLRQNRISNSGAQVLVKMLEANTTLRALVLDGNNINEKIVNEVNERVRNPRPNTRNKASVLEPLIIDKTDNYLYDDSKSVTQNKVLTKTRKRGFAFGWVIRMARNLFSKSSAARRPVTDKNSGLEKEKGGVFSSEKIVEAEVVNISDFTVQGSTNANVFTHARPALQSEIKKFIEGFEIFEEAPSLTNKDNQHDIMSALTEALHAKGGEDKHFNKVLRDTKNIRTVRTALREFVKDTFEGEDVSAMDTTIIKKHAWSFAETLADKLMEQQPKATRKL